MTLDSMPELLIVDEVARYLRIGRTRAYEMIAKGEIPHVRCGKRITIKKSDLASYVERTSGENHQTR